MVSITSQGQITVPINMRKYLGVQKKQMIKAQAVNGKIILEKITDIEDLAGIFADQAKKITKGMTRKQILEAEEKAAEEGWTNRFKNE